MKMPPPPLLPPGTLSSNQVVQFQSWGYIMQITFNMFNFVQLCCHCVKSHLANFDRTLLPGDSAGRLVLLHGTHCLTRVDYTWAGGVHGVLVDQGSRRGVVRISVPVDKRVLHVAWQHTWWGKGFIAKTVIQPMGLMYVFALELGNRSFFLRRLYPPFA